MTISEKAGEKKLNRIKFAYNDLGDILNYTLA
jgi:hypothetical protein